MRTTNRLGAIPLTMDRNICAKLVSLDKMDGKKEGGQTRTFLQYASTISSSDTPWNKQTCHNRTQSKPLVKTCQFWRRFKFLMLLQHLCDLGRLHLQYSLQVVCVSWDRRVPLTLLITFYFNRVYTSTGSVMISCQVFLSGTPHPSVCKISEGFLDKWVYFERIWCTTLFRAAHGWWYHGAPIFAKWEIAYNVRHPNQR
jgi:hypothetical protein